MGVAFRGGEVPEKGMKGYLEDIMKTMHTAVKLIALASLVVGCSSNNSDRDRILRDQRLMQAQMASYYGNRYGSNYTSPASTTTFRNSYQQAQMERMANMTSRNGLSGNLMMNGTQGCWHIDSQTGKRVPNQAMFARGLCGALPGTSTVPSTTSQAPTTTDRRARTLNRDAQPMSELNIVAKRDDPVGMAKFGCSEAEYFEGEDSDRDGIGDECERSEKGRANGLDPFLVNGYKVAAFRLPKQKDKWTKELLPWKSGDKQKSFNLELLRVDTIREVINRVTEQEKKDKNYAILPMRKPYDSWPTTVTSSFVLEAGNWNRALTLGGIDEFGDWYGEFALDTLPQVQKVPETIDEGDGFLYVVEAILNVPRRWNPILKIAGSSAGSENATAMAVLINGEIAVETFDKNAPVESRRLHSSLKEICTSGEDCHMVALLYSEDGSNKGRSPLVEALLIDVDSRDDRGFEPLPAEIARPVPLHGALSFDTKIKQSSLVLEVAEEVFMTKAPTVAP